jgi:hypothetical protein
MTANVDAMVRAGVEAYRAGKRAEARTLLERALELDNYNELAWMWLSAVVDTPEEQRTCLENVVVINPENERAKQGLRSLGVDPDTIINAQDEPAAEEVAVDDFMQDDLFASEIDISQGSAASEAFGTDDLFADTDFSADQPFEFDEDLFADETGDEVYGDDEYYEEDASYESDAGYIDENYVDEGFHDGDEFYADKTTLEQFSEAVSSGDMNDYDEKLFQRDPYYVAPVAEVDDAPDPQELFRQIPAEIEATRLPGTDEEAPSTHYAIMGALGVLNLIALIFMILQFAS